MRSGLRERAPLLLLHGFPQTTAAQDCTLWPKAYNHSQTGYGDSAVRIRPDHAAYAKRAMANDMVGLMDSLGHDSFMVAGHDRGAGGAPHGAGPCGPSEPACGSGHRPTAAMYGQTDMRFATAYYHWFYLIQPAPFPERMIGADAEFYLAANAGSGAARPARLPMPRSPTTSDVFPDGQDSCHVRGLSRRGNH